MTEKVLCVDDDTNILFAYQRHLRRQFNIHTAQGGAEGLAAIAERGPYAVVVSDLRMPTMDGIQFLSRVRERAPDTVRVMLTGNVDLETAIAAVNKGNIFRFLTKPCPPEMLGKTLESAIDQYRLITAERELLEKTVSGSIKVLTDILALVNPMAFSRASRLKRYVGHIAERLQLPDIWQFEVAALLSQIGCVTLPQDTLDKIYSNEPLSTDEQTMYSSHPSVGEKLLARIPRLESIARMIAMQQSSSERNEFVTSPRDRDVVVLGTQMLQVSLEFDRLVSSGMSSDTAGDVLCEKPDRYDAVMVSALRDLGIGERQMKVMSLRVRDLNTSMILAEEVRTKTELLLATKGQEVSYPVLQRLRNFAQKVGVKEPFRVFVPRERDGHTDVPESRSTTTLSHVA